MTVSGHVKFPNNLNAVGGGTLVIPDGTLIEPTLTFASSVVQIGNNFGDGSISQTGGSLVVNRTDGTSGNPKSSLGHGWPNQGNPDWTLYTTIQFRKTG